MSMMDEKNRDEERADEEERIGEPVVALANRNTAMLAYEKLCSAESAQLRFEANSYLTSGADGAVYFASKTAIFRWYP